MANRVLGLCSAVFPAGRQRLSAELYSQTSWRGPLIARARRRGSPSLIKPRSAQAPADPDGNSVKCRAANSAQHHQIVQHNTLLISTAAGYSCPKRATPMQMLAMPLPIAVNCGQSRCP